MTDDTKPFDPLPGLRFMSKTENWELALMASSAVELIESLTARLAEAEARIDRALALSDTGSAAHQERFYNRITGYEIPPGWRVVEAMRGELING